MLEPSPPVVQVGPWFADDPVNEPALPPVISPIANGDLTWDEVAAGDEEMRQWCLERALVVPRLEPLAVGFAASRDALHRLAFHVLAPARHAANTKIGLRFTFGGFGTPFFGEGVQLRVQGTWLVVQKGDGAEAEPLTTLGAARRLAGVRHSLPFNGPEAWPDDRPIEAGPLEVASLANWFGFTTHILEELRAEASHGDNPSRVQIWPEHFDPALEIGSEEGGHRAAFGGSPGDEGHPEPYLYVSPWTPQPADPFWNDEHFPGASLSYTELLGAPDQRAAALTFFGRGRRILAGGP